MIFAAQRLLGKLPEPGHDGRIEQVEAQRLGDHPDDVRRACRRFDLQRDERVTQATMPELHPLGRLVAQLDEGGAIDVLTAPDGALMKLNDVVDNLNQLAPVLAGLAPTVDKLYDAVLVLNDAVNPLSNIAGRIPLSRQRGKRAAARAAQRAVDANGQEQPGPSTG